LGKLVEDSIYDEVFVFGDLNYRLMIDKEQASRLIPQQKFLSMIKHDALRQQEALKFFIGEYTEGTLTFPPSWTDRIFFKSEN
jgi:hypothetical protein